MKLVITRFIFCFVLFSFFINEGYTQKQGGAAIDSMKKSLSIAASDTNKAKTIYHIASTFSNINPDSAKIYAEYGLSFAKKLKWQKGIAVFYACIGNLYNDNSDYTNALKYFNESYLINIKINNKSNTIANLIDIGSVYQRQGNDVKALEYNFKALKLAEKVKNNPHIAILYANIANSYFSQSDYQKSLNYNFKSLKEAQKLKDKNRMADAYNNIATNYFELNKLKEAEIFYHRSLKLYKSLENKTGQGVILSQIALLFENDKDKKLEYLLNAQQLFDSTSPLHGNSINNIGNIGGTYADIFINKRIDNTKIYKNIPLDYTVIEKKAEEYLNRAINYSKQVKDAGSLSYFSDNLSQLQEKKGDYKQALSYYRQSRIIDDSLYSQESKNKIAALEAQYLFQKKEDEYKQQQQITKLKMKQLYLYAILSIVFISSVLIYLLNRSRIGRLRLKNKLQKKEAEERTRELLHRNKLSESELKAIRAQMNPHFIFNVLNSIESYIVENDSKMASRLVQKFASLSRLILENSTQSLVTADREWKALQLYTELEAMRFNNQFGYSFYADPLIDLSTLMLPPMLVQPLIENAIHHGMRNSTAVDNKVTVKLEQTTNNINFTVEDNGAGIDETQNFKTFSTIKNKSIGLSAIRERIEIINILNAGEPAYFEIHKKNPDEGLGTIAKLTLPKILRKN